jgi:hypothetical protein
VQTGVNDGRWIEVQLKRLGGSWVPFDGKEEIITNLSELSNGAQVRIATAEES